MCSPLPAIPSLSPHTSARPAPADLNSPLIIADTSHQGLTALTLTLSVEQLIIRLQSLLAVTAALQHCVLSAE